MNSRAWHHLDCIDAALHALRSRLSSEAHAALEAALAQAAIEVLHKAGGHVAVDNARSMRVAAINRRLADLAGEAWLRRRLDELHS